MRRYNLHFEGSLLDEYRSNLPTYSGIYLVYRGTLSTDRKSLICAEIIYIGQAEDIRRRLSAHNKRTEFFEKLQKGEVLFYSYAKVEQDNLDRVENALIYKCQPTLNETGRDSFPYPSTVIDSDGQCALLQRHIVLDDTRE